MKKLGYDVKAFIFHSVQLLFYLIQNVSKKPDDGEEFIPRFKVLLPVSFEDTDTQINFQSRTSKAKLLNFEPDTFVLNPREGPSLVPNYHLLQISETSVLEPENMETEEYEKNVMNSDGKTSSLSISLPTAKDFELETPTMLDKESQRLAFTCDTALLPTGDAKSHNDHTAENAVVDSKVDTEKPSHLKSGNFRRITKFFQ